MKLACTFGSILGPLLFAATTLGAPTPSKPDVTLSPGDAIRLGFWREPDLSGEFLVDETGTAVLPVIGAVEVGGLSDSLLKEELRQRYAGRLRHQQVQITALRRVRVLGEVREPGLYHVDPTMRLGDALALAGGTTSNGLMDDVRVFRDGELLLTSADWDAWITEPMRSGDEIFVAERSWLSRNGALLVGATLTLTGLVIGATVNSN